MNNLIWTQPVLADQQKTNICHLCVYRHWMTCREPAKNDDGMEGERESQGNLCYQRDEDDFEMFDFWNSKVVRFFFNPNFSPPNIYLKYFKNVHQPMKAKIFNILGVISCQ